MVGRVLIRAKVFEIQYTLRLRVLIFTIFTYGGKNL